MKMTARAFVLTTVVLLLTLPVLYVGGEGVFYLATGRSHFPTGSGYRKLYAPFDSLSDRWPAIYDARESLASQWTRLGSRPGRRIFIRPKFFMNGFTFTLDVF